MERGIYGLEQAVCQPGIFLSSVLHFPGLPANIGTLLKFSPIIRQEEHIYFEQIQTSDVTG
jgi:hypothetical protein